MTDQSQQPAASEELFNETLVDLAPWLAGLRESLAKPGPAVSNIAKGMKYGVVPKKVAFYTDILQLQQEGVRVPLGYRSASDFATRNDFSFYFKTPQLNSEQPDDTITVTSCTCGQVWLTNLMRMPLPEFQALPEHLTFDRVLATNNQ